LLSSDINDKVDANKDGYIIEEELKNAPRPNRRGTRRRQ
jgi:hypothetical protein